MFANLYVLVALAVALLGAGGYGGYEVGHYFGDSAGYERGVGVGKSVAKREYEARQAKAEEDERKRAKERQDAVDAERKKFGEAMKGFSETTIALEAQLAADRKKLAAVQAKLKQASAPTVCWSREVVRVLNQ